MGGSKLECNLGGCFLKILIGCEFSGRVRDAFIAKGHNAVSCDLRETERPGPHIIGDLRKELSKDWDMLIAFPDCTHLAVSGARWFKNKITEQQEALQFVCDILNAKIPRIAMENPIGIISNLVKPTQIVHPYWFGDPERKATCLWLEHGTEFDLPKLVPTNTVVPNYKSAIHYEPPGPNQAKNRSRTFPGVAFAMADQWG